MDTNWENLSIYTNEKKIEKVKENITAKEIKYVIVLAGGLQENGKVHSFVQTRLDKAIDLYIDIRSKNHCKIIVMGGGTYHKPPFLNKDKYVIHESTSCAQYLYCKGIPAEDIYREWSSYDTIANGFYCFLNYVLPLEIKHCILITSEFHIERTKSIFEFFNFLCENYCLFEYVIVNNNGIPSCVLNDRIEREKKSCIQFQKTIKDSIKSWKEFTSWFYTQHNAYKSIIEYKNNDKINKSY
jgi:hypothetical protein